MTFLTPHQQAALDHTRHISLTANAGSGKTFVLSKRYLEIALKENIPLRNIAAITFTDKAAGELYKKISGDIDKLIQVAEDKLTLKKLELLRRQLVSANISTIHSFCIDVLREYPVEAQLDANFSPIDENTSDELIELSIEEVIKESLNILNEAEELKPLIRLFSSKGRLSSEMSGLIKNRKNVLDTSPVYSGTAEDTASIFYNSFLEAAERIFNKEKIGSFVKNMVLINDAAFSLKQSQTAIEARYHLSIIQQSIHTEEFLKKIKILSELVFTREGNLKKRGYLPSGEAREELSALISEVEGFFKEIGCFLIPDNHREIELELARTGKGLFHLFSRCLDRYELKKKDEGYLDYEDLLLHTKKVLENKQVRLSLADKFKYIMVDEYQDTNEIQYKIFLPILDYLKKNNLFVVGDEKQSIYMFRDAELEVFNRTKKDIIKSSGEDSLLTLPDSFRMAPGLCLFTNYLFSNLFANPQIGFNEVAHSDIICARQTEMKGDVEILLTEEKADEADLAASRLLKLVHEEKLYQWGQIAVLCRKRKSFSELEEAFTKKGIPYSIIGGKGFYQRQAVYDIYNYFAFLLDERNDASLAGILRSPFFNISDADLFQISIEYGSIFWEKCKKFSETNTSLASAVKMIEENILLSRNYDLTPILRKMLKETNYFAVIASGVNGEQEIANINKFIRLTGNFFAHGYKTLFDYVNFIKDSIESEEDEAQAAVSDESDSVKIMTIHQAKGLEYDVVVLYKSNDSSKNNSAKSKEVIVDKNYGLLTKVPLHNQYFREYLTAPVVNLSSYISKKKNLAEIKRLFYVAVTRAKDLLIISSLQTERPKEDSFTGLLVKGLGINFKSDKYTISSKLKYLKPENNSYNTFEKDLELVIPLHRNIEVLFQSNTADTLPESKLLINLNQIEDLPNGEIISATKYSVYKECPVKYSLIYEYGFSGTLIEPDELENPGIFEDEEAENLSGLRKYANIKGSIIHRVLQQEVLPEELKSEGMIIIKHALKELNISENQMQLITNSILSDLQSYFNSDLYKKIKAYTSFNNEYNIYFKVQDYFLYGIIDKLAEDGRKRVIIDYKTDDISEEKLAKRSAKYFNQLKFYSYIIKSAFKNIAELELKLVYIRHPEKAISCLVTPEELKTTGDDISGMVKEIRNKRFLKNPDHCRICQFYTKNSGCIIN